MIDFSKLGLDGLDLSFLPPSILGRLSFRHRPSTLPPLPPGRHLLQVTHPGEKTCDISGPRETVLVVPEDLPTGTPVPLLVMFHGANGSAEKVLPFFEQYAHQHKFLLMLPQSTFPTWDLTIAGNGPDLEKLDKALSLVASHFDIDTSRFAFCGFSDGASYSLSIGVSNGDLLSHVIVLSGGFMNAYQLVGEPLIFVAHSPEDEQLPIHISGRKYAKMLKEAGYDVEYLEFSGQHRIYPHVVEKAMDFFLKKSKRVID